MYRHYLFHIKKLIINSNNIIPTFQTAQIKMNSKRLAFATCYVHLVKFTSALDLLNWSNAVFYHGGTMDPRSTSELLTKSVYFDDFQCYETFETNSKLGKLPYLKIEPGTEHMFGFDMKTPWTVGSFHIFAGEDLRSSSNSYSFNELT